MRGGTEICRDMIYFMSSFSEWFTAGSVFAGIPESCYCGKPPRTNNAVQPFHAA